MTRLISVALLLALTPLSHAAEDALHEVNAARAARGLPPFAHDPALTAAAQAAADHRARFRIAGHVGGGMGDFGFLPAGASADAAGCGALEPSWGWGTCCTYENYQAAGAAVTMGPDGRRYMHLFVRGGGGSGVRQAAWGNTSYTGYSNYAGYSNSAGYSTGRTYSRRGFFRR